VLRFLRSNTGHNVDFRWNPLLFVLTLAAVSSDKTLSASRQKATVENSVGGGGGGGGGGGEWNGMDGME
jgi:uncharacterized membrane protein